MKAVSTAEVIRAGDVGHSIDGRDVPVLVASEALLVEAADAAVIAQISDLDRRGESGAWVASSVDNSRMEMAILAHALAVRLSGQVIILCGVVDAISTGGAIVHLRLAINRVDTAPQALDSLAKAMPGLHVSVGVVVSVH